MAAKKKVAARKVRIESVSKPRSKGEVYRTIAENTELSRKQVQSVFDTLGAVIAQDLRTVKVFQVPGLMKVIRVDKPATKQRTAPNPFRPGEMMTIKAKPARKIVKVRPLKGLKSLV